MRVEWSKSWEPETWRRPFLLVWRFLLKRGCPVFQPRPLRVGGTCDNHKIQAPPCPHLASPWVSPNKIRSGIYDATVFACQRAMKEMVCDRATEGVLAEGFPTFDWGRLELSRKLPWLELGRGGDEAFAVVD